MGDINFNNTLYSNKYIQIIVTSTHSQYESKIIKEIFAFFLFVILST